MLDETRAGARTPVFRVGRWRPARRALSLGKGQHDQDNSQRQVGDIGRQGALAWVGPAAPACQRPCAGAGRARSPAGRCSVRVTSRGWPRAAEVLAAWRHPARPASHLLTPPRTQRLDIPPGDAVDHRVGASGGLARAGPGGDKHGQRVMRGPDLGQDGDGQRRDHGHLPGDQQQIDRARGPDSFRVDQRTTASPRKVAGVQA